MTVKSKEKVKGKKTSQIQQTTHMELIVKMELLELLFEEKSQEIF